jgi:hypothetical protein
VPDKGAGLPAEAGCGAQHDGHLHCVPRAVLLIPHAQQQLSLRRQLCGDLLLTASSTAALVHGLRQNAKIRMLKWANGVHAPRLILCREVAGESGGCRTPLVPQSARGSQGFDVCQLSSERQLAPSEYSSPLDDALEPTPSACQQIGSLCVRSTLSTFATPLLCTRACRHASCAAIIRHTSHRHLGRVAWLHGGSAVSAYCDTTSVS